LKVGDITLMSIATQTGDNGTTALMFGRRVSKTDIRVAAYGSVDELNSALGMVRAFSGDAEIASVVLVVQNQLVTLMGELAVHPEDRARYAEKGFKFVEAAMVDELTQRVNDLETGHNISFKHWATPGATPGRALLDIARTACRRAERNVVFLHEAGGDVNPEVVRYLNRLSDLCWLWARWVETKAGVAG
jgi:cob(I)alamin adenosyltransferase